MTMITELVIASGISAAMNALPVFLTAMFKLFSNLLKRYQSAMGPIVHKVNIECTITRSSAYGQMHSSYHSLEVIIAVTSFLRKRNIINSVTSMVSDLSIGSYALNSDREQCIKDITSDEEVIEYLADNIYCQYEDMEFTFGNETEDHTNGKKPTTIIHITMNVSSKKRPVNEINKFIKTIYAGYTYDKNNYMYRDSKYVFHVNRITRSGNIRASTCLQDKHCLDWDNYPNSEIPFLKSRIESLNDDKLAIMLHGPPGVGKSELIKTIAKTTNRHIINLNLSQITNVQTLRNLFYGHQSINTGDLCDFAYTPSDIVLVCEEIDTFFKTMKRNEMLELAALTKGLNHDIESVSDDINSEESSDVSDNQPGLYDSNNHLSELDLLTILSGISKPKGLIIVFTTNHIEELDTKRMFRAGRIDFDISMRGFNIEDIKKKLKKGYPDIETSTIDSLEIIDEYLNPANFTRLMNNFSSSFEIVKEALTRQ